MKLISLKLPEALDRQLRQRAAEAGASRSELLRRALELYLGQGDREDGSFAAAAADLAGCFQGATDLSTSPAHLADYGA